MEVDIKQNNIVYIYSGNANAIVHATNAIETWGYWRVTENKEEADFVLKFNIRFWGLGEAFCVAKFIYPKNNKIIKTTKEVNTLGMTDLNSKRAVINKIVKKYYRSLLEQYLNSYARC